MPELPTIAATVPDFEAVQWYGIVAPARTPATVITLLNAEIGRALQTPALKARLDAEGAEAAPGTPGAFGALIASEIARWKPVIEQSHMQPE
jgi:tripartite-type tricarboxylate transporter receptor subunit TctC